MAISKGQRFFLDTNFNLIREPNEASAITDADGQFEILLSAEQQACLAYAPLVANVPMGAIDLTLGEVTQPFDMILPLDSSRRPVRPSSSHP